MVKFVHSVQRFCFLPFTLILLISIALSMSLSKSTSIQAASPFVVHAGTQFVLNGSPFYFGGTNNYYPIYVSNKMVDDFLQSAHTQGLKVVRVWAMNDIGVPDDPATSIDGGKNNVYFQYWDKAAGKPAYNDGENGLKKLDYVLKRAADFDLKVVPVLINNWEQFGGIDQYVKWYALPSHDTFYTNAKTQDAYKNWANHLITRINSISGVSYLNDPTVFAWELANEPRCKGSGKMPTSASCTTTTLTNWVSMMSAYIKSIDPNHMVTVGDEGFFKRPGSSSWPYSGGEGVDTEAFLNVDTIDYGTYHLYPQDWGVNVDIWPIQWITDHIAAGKTFGKPEVLEEFGFKTGDKRDAHYEQWVYTVCANGGAGWMYWLLTGHQDDGTYYPDYDSYNVNDTLSTYALLKSDAEKISTQQCGNPPPMPIVTPTSSVTNTPSATTAPGATVIDDSVSGTEPFQLNYSGNGWTHCTDCNEPSPAIFYNASQSWDSITDDFVTLAFTGTRVTYYAVVGPSHGMAAVSIDGGDEIVIDLYGTTKTGNVSVWTSPKLVAGSHTLKIRVAGKMNTASTGNVITLDHVDVITAEGAKAVS